MDRQPTHAGHLRRARAAQGWTLIEQLMVLVIVAVLVTIALPSMGKVLARSRLQSAQMDLMAGLQHARYIAVSRGLPAVFCPSDDGSDCVRTSRWEGGWLIGMDRNGDNHPDQSAIVTGPQAPAGMHVRSSVGRYRVRFHPDGSAAGTNLTITLCLPGRDAKALNVVVSNAGRVRGERASEAQTMACIGRT